MAKAAGKEIEAVRPASAELLQQVTDKVKQHFLSDPENVARAMAVFDRDGGGEVLLGQP